MLLIITYLHSFLYLLYLSIDKQEGEVYSSSIICQKVFLYQIGIGVELGWCETKIFINQEWFITIDRSVALL